MNRSFSSVRQAFYQVDFVACGTERIPPRVLSRKGRLTVNRSGERCCVLVVVRGVFVYQDVHEQEGHIHFMFVLKLQRWMKVIHLVKKLLGRLSRSVE